VIYHADLGRCLAEPDVSARADFGLVIDADDDVYWFWSRVII